MRFGQISQPNFMEEIMNYGKITKRATVGLVTAVTLFSPVSVGLAYADGVLTAAPAQELQVDFTSKEVANVTSDQATAADKVSDMVQSGTDIDTAIKNAVNSPDYADTAKIIENKIASEAKSEDVTNGEKVNIDTNLPTKTYNIGDNTAVIFNDDIIEVDKTTITDEPAPADKPTTSTETNFVATSLNFLDNLFFTRAEAATNTTRTRSIYTEKSFYNPILGFRVARVYTGGTVTYNGSRAWYNSNYQGGYQYYPGSILDSHDFQKKSQAQGNNWVFSAGGWFTNRIGIKGAGVVFNDRYFSTAVLCTPSGQQVTNP